jgi:hypothetical protein
MVERLDYYDGLQLDPLPARFKPCIQKGARFTGHHKFDKSIVSG